MKRIVISLLALILGYGSVTQAAPPRCQNNCPKPKPPIAKPKPKPKPKPPMTQRERHRRDNPILYLKGTVIK